MHQPHVFEGTVLMASLVLAGLGSACSSKAGPAGGTGGSGASAAGCAQSALKILFNPMYSAYDGVHTFQLPAIVSGIDQANAKVNWSVSDPSMVALAPDPATGGVMITMQKAGVVSVYARTGDLCGAAVLTITAATPEEWMAGSKRYNDGVVISLGGGASQDDGGAAMPQQAACTNCHGDTATGPFKDVAHTPEQIGGFSDEELIGIFQRGVIPQGGYFDAMIVPLALWQAFHQWDVGDAAKGVVVYLRSLTPAAQKGSFNFGALADAGIPEVGSPGSDAGAGEPDAGPVDGSGDAGSEGQ